MTNKYNARKTKYDGHTFDSMAERNRYVELRLLEREGLIKDLRVHPRYEVFPAHTIEVRRNRAIHYEPDFTYSCEGKLVVEDIKGVETQVFKIKRKLFEAKFDTPITIIKA